MRANFSAFEQDFCLEDPQRDYYACFFPAEFLYFIEALANSHILCHAYSLLLNRPDIYAFIGKLVLIKIVLSLLVTSTL